MDCFKEAHPASTDVEQDAAEKFAFVPKSARNRSHSVEMRLVPTRLTLLTGIPGFTFFVGSSRRRDKCGGFVRFDVVWSTLLKKGCKCFLGFQGLHTRGEFLVFAFHRALKLVPR